jgi:hypothetical protein
MRLAFIVVWFAALAAHSDGQGLSPRLSNGVVTYVGEDGTRKEIKVGRKCADLWVSPDENAVAFIAIDRSKPPVGGEIEPFIEESTVYVARKADAFRPIPFALNIELDGRVWHIAREPKLSPDLLTLYFFVPNSMAGWTLVSRPVRADIYRVVARGADYCVMWGGDHSGDLALLTRVDPRPGDPNGGVRYPCSWRRSSGEEVELASDCFAAFDDVVAKWSAEHGGACR